MAVIFERRMMVGVAALVGTCLWGTASRADVLTSNPNDYYTTASTHLGVPGITTENAPGNVGQAFSSTSDTRSGSEMAPNALGGTTTYVATASGFAYADLSAGMVGAFSETATSPGVPICCVAQPLAQSTAIIADLLTFTAAGATPTTVTTITASFRIDGYAVGDLPGETPLTVSAGLGGSIGLIALPLDSAIPHLTGEFVNVQPTITPGVAYDQTFSVSTTFTGPTAEGEIYLKLLSTAEGYDTSSDFYRTGAVTLDLPANVTFTSASGVFLTAQSSQSIPEPRSVALVGSFLVVAARSEWLRRSRAKNG